MNVSSVSFKSAYISEEAKFLLNGKQKSAIYSWGYNQSKKHLSVSLKHDADNVPVGILFRIADKLTTEEQARTILRLNASEKAIKNTLKTLMSKIKARLR